MKSLSVKVGVVLFIFGLIILGNIEVWGADWRVYGEPASDIGVYYYDADSISSPSKNIVRVWEKVVYSAKGVISHIEELGELYENLSYTVTLWEVDCVQKKEQILKTNWYSKDETSLSSTEFQKTSWTFVNPDSMGEALYEVVCK